MSSKKKRINELTNLKKELLFKSQFNAMAQSFEHEKRRIARKRISKSIVPGFSR